MTARRHFFPAAIDTAVAPFDPARLDSGLTELLEGLCGAPVELACAPSGDLPLGWWRRDDGLACGIGGGSMLAAALVSRDCGGAFDADELPSGAASVVRTQERLAARLRALLARLLPGDGEWAPAEPRTAPTHSWLVDVGGVADRIDLAVVVPVEVADHSIWRGALHERLSRLDVAVRLVLHDAPIAVRAAQRLAAGDTLPIATASEVGLRVGRLALATARIVGSDGDRPSIEILARPRAFREQHA